MLFSDWSNTSKSSLAQLTDTGARRQRADGGEGGEWGTGREEQSSTSDSLIDSELVCLAHVRCIMSPSFVLGVLFERADHPRFMD